MADEKKKSSWLKVFKYGIVSLGLCYSAYFIDSCSHHDIDEKVLTGKKIELEDDAVVYGTLTDMINCTNGKNAYYDTSYDRLVISTFYEVDGEFIRIDMKGTYVQKEREIIEKNGIVVGVITTVDFVNQTPEAFYRCSDFKVKQKVKSLV